MAKLVGLAGGAAYIAGFLVANIHAQRFGAFTPGLFRTEYALAGVPVVALILAHYALGLRPRWLCGLAVLDCVCLAVVLWVRFVVRRNNGDALTPWIDETRVLCVGASVLAAASVSAMVSRRRPSQTVLMCANVASAAAVVFAWGLLAYGYVPRVLGGGKPANVVVYVDEHSLPKKFLMYHVEDQWLGVTRYAQPEPFTQAVAPLEGLLVFTSDDELFVLPTSRLALSRLVAVPKRCVVLVRYEDRELYGISSDSGRLARAWYRFFWPLSRPFTYGPRTTW